MDAFAIADNVILVAGQEVLQNGRPLRVYADPANLAAADLLSEPGVNWLDAGDHLEVVRPEHLRRSAADIDGQALRYRVQPQSVETNGSHTFVQGTLLEPVVAAASERWVARLPGMPEPGALLSEAELSLFVDARNRILLPGSGGAAHGVA